MTEKRDWNSKLLAKGLEQFVSEEQARGMAVHQGSRYLLLLEVHSGKKVVNEDGSQVVSLVADQVELVPADHENRVREFMRALYLNRPDQFGQAAFDGAAGDEPSVEQTAAQIDAAISRDESGDVAGVWDGNTDGPLRAVPDGPEFTGCDFPGCVLDAEHDGDHDVVTDDEPASV